MNIYTLVGQIALIGLVVAIVTALIKRPHNYILHYLRSFLGTFFIYSGFVKAIDPVGTKIKMDDYFNVFTEHFSFLNFIWEPLLGFTLAFAIIMIILEIVLGFSLILVTFKKMTLFLYLGIILFFTVLTGFTYLTGYVPKDNTFFEFGKWTNFQSNQMRVTDCGCFGDFVKLKPYESFIKDVILTGLILLIIPLSRKFDFLFTRKLSYLLLGIFSVLTIWFTFRNVNNLPIKDFRAYSIGTNIVDCASEEGLDPGEKIVKFIVEKDGTTETITSEQFSKYSKDGWKYKDRMDEVIREPESPKCKDFLVINEDGDEIQDVVKNQKGISYWVNSYDLHKSNPKGFEKINALLKQVEGTKLGLTATEITEANKVTDGVYKFYNLDATPIKTMNRANPGLTVLKDGVIIAKYHYKHLPSVEKLNKLIAQ